MKKPKSNVLVISIILFLIFKIGIIGLLVYFNSPNYENLDQGYKILNAQFGVIFIILTMTVIGILYLIKSAK